VIERIGEPFKFIAGFDGAANLQIAFGNIVHQPPQLPHRPENHTLGNHIKRNHSTRGGNQAGKNHTQPIHQRRAGHLPRKSANHQHADLLIGVERHRRALFGMALQTGILGANQPKIQIAGGSVFFIVPGGILRLLILHHFRQFPALRFGQSRQRRRSLVRLVQPKPPHYIVIRIGRAAQFRQQRPASLACGNQMKMPLKNQLRNSPPRIQNAFFRQFAHPEIGDGQGQQKRQQHRSSEQKPALFRQRQGAKPNQIHCSGRPPVQRCEQSLHLRL